MHDVSLAVRCTPLTVNTTTSKLSHRLNQALEYFVPMAYILTVVHVHSKAPEISSIGKRGAYGQASNHNFGGVITDVTK